MTEDNLIVTTIAKCLGHYRELWRLKLPCRHRNPWLRVAAKSPVCNNQYLH